MSAAARQQTCAACGSALSEDDRIDLEPLIDDIVRYIAVHWECSTDPLFQKAKTSHGQERQHASAS